MPKRTTLDWVLESAALAVLVFIFMNVAAHWSELPDRVPRHYGISGNPNRWGGKNWLWALPITAVGLYVFLAVASRYPKLINLPFTVDRELPEVRKLLLTMTLFMRTTLLLVLAYLSWAGMNVALGRTQGLGRSFLLIVLAAVFGPLVFFTLRLRRYRT